MAGALNKSSEAASYQDIVEKFKPVFHKHYFNQTTGSYGKTALEVQTTTVTPLAAKLVPNASVNSVLTALKADIDSRGGHLTTGSIGQKYLYTQLSQHGMHDTALKVATKTDFPSFGYWLSKGATTCWEDYSGIASPSHPPPPTHNHIFLCGGVGEWMYRDVAGNSL